MKIHQIRGSTLFIVMTLVAIGSVVLGMIFQATTTSSRLQNQTSNRTAAIAIADGILEHLFERWQSVFSTNIDVPSDADFAAANASAILKPVPDGFAITNSSIVSVDSSGAPTGGRPTLEEGISIENSAKIKIYSYLASVTVRYPSRGGRGEVTVQRTFRHGRSLFPDGYFNGTQRAEAQPGDILIMRGNNYTEGDFFTAHNTLKIAGDFVFRGSHYIGYAPYDKRKVDGIDPTIDTDGFPDNWSLANPPRNDLEQKLLDIRRAELDPNFVKDPSELPDRSDANVDSDGNPNNDGPGEIIQYPEGDRTLPENSDPFDVKYKYRLPESSDYRVDVDASGNVKVFEGRSESPLPATSPAAQALSSAVTGASVLADAREQRPIRLNKVDVSIITNKINDGTLRDNNSYKKAGGGGDGISIFLLDRSVGVPVSVGGTDNVTSRAFRLVNGSELPNVGLTLASQNPIYIQGDYNTGSANGVNTPSNRDGAYNPFDSSVNGGNWENPSAPPESVAPGYNRSPAAVVADAINILSNNWSANESSSRNVASNTTINAFLVSGNRPTSLPHQPGQPGSIPSQPYSGGIENFPRLHEGWGNGKFLTIRGAMALLFNSQQAIGYWRNANYGVPKRRWFFDSELFDEAGRSPAGFPPRVSYSKGDRIIR
jgi:hypothetical protein